jgi:hypothetical protein
MVSAERQAYLREYYQKNKARLNAMNVEWTKAHPERRAEIRRKWKETHPEYDSKYYETNKKWIRAQQAEYRGLHPEMQKAWREAHPEYFAEWRKAHRMEKNEEWHLYRARQMSNGPFEFISRRKVWERDGGICGICKQPADEQNWHVDHVIPLSKGGTHTYDNVQVAHPVCNLSKGAK